MLIKKILKNNNGDTIIEVLMAIVVLSLVLTTSYALANRSSQAVRQAQERSEALKYSQEQLEKLRNFVQINTNWTASGYECFANGSNTPTSSATNCGFGTDSRYKVKISVGTAPNTYRLKTNWDNVAGNGQDTLELSYRLPSLEYTATPAPPPPPPPAPTNISPVASFTYTANNLAVTFTNSSTDADNDPLTSSWNFGDGSTSTAKNPSHSYGSAGNKSVSLTVNDGQGGTNTSTRTVNVTAPPPHPARQPLYRCYQGYVPGSGAGTRFVTDHYVSTDPASCGPNIASTAPWVSYEGVIGYVPLNTNSGSVPVYGGFEQSYWYDTYLTTDYNGYLYAHYSGWNVDSRVRFYIYPYSGGCSESGTVPLYRSWNGTTGDHLFGTGYNEGIYFGYGDDGVVGCMFTSP